jgi:hypothetical protein
MDGPGRPQPHRRRGRCPDRRPAPDRRSGFPSTRRTSGPCCKSRACNCCACRRGART